MMDRRHHILSLETLALAVVGMLAIGLRWGALDWPPLAPEEASAALAALRLTPATSALDPSSGPPISAAYGALTALLFDAFGAGDALARVVPALAGIALLGLPLVLRRTAGPGSTLATVVLLAISPVLVLTSRTAGGQALSLAALAGAWVTVMRSDVDPGRRAAWSAALLGLAFASGPWTLTGLLGIALGQVLHAAASRTFAVGLWRQLRSMPFYPRRDLVILGAVLIGMATAFGLERGALSGVAVSLAEWLRGWTQPSGLGIGTALVSLALYEPLVLLAGLLGIARWRTLSDFQRGLATWAAGALVVALLYPGRGYADLAWCVVPLAVLAAQTVAGAVDRLAQEEHRTFQAVLIGLLILLIVFAYLELAGYARGIGRGPAFDPTLELGLAIGALLLAVVITVLFGLGWSWRMALGSLQIVGLMVALAAAISALSTLCFAPGAATARELLRVEAATAESRLLAVTAAGVSTGQTGSPSALPVRLQASASPVLAWTLRSFPLDVATDVRANDLPRLVLSPKAAAETGLAAEYVGQTFTISERKAWTGILPSGLLTYLVRREAPVAPEQWLLLVRADVASFGELPAQPAPAEPES